MVTRSSGSLPEPVCRECRRAGVKAGYGRRDPATLKPCGTVAAYARHRQHGEKPCDKCRTARRERDAARNGKQPCGGGCGNLVWRGSTSLPNPVCRACRKAGVKAGYGARAVRAECTREGCAGIVSGPNRTYCSFECWQIGRPGSTPEAVAAQAAIRRAQRRQQNHKRRQQVPATTDLTAAVELALRTAAFACPLCAATLTDAPYLPASKELDHVVPLCAGGAHVLANVRIICRACNQRRPSDGSDYTGPITADMAPGYTPPRVPRVIVRRPCCSAPASSAHRPGCPERRVRRPNRPRLAAQALTLRGTGMKWREIAAALDLPDPATAYYYANQAGDPRAPANALVLVSA